MYKIIICTANISHKSWWNGKPSYKFDSFAEIVRCLKQNGSFLGWQNVMQKQKTVVSPAHPGMRLLKGNIR